MRFDNMDVGRAGASTKAFFQGVANKLVKAFSAFVAQPLSFPSTKKLLSSMFKSHGKTQTETIPSEKPAPEAKLSPNKRYAAHVSSAAKAIAQSLGSSDEEVDLDSALTPLSKTKGLRQKKMKARFGDFTAAVRNLNSYFDDWSDKQLPKVVATAQTESGARAEMREAGAQVGVYWNDAEGRAFVIAGDRHFGVERTGKPGDDGRKFVEVGADPQTADETLMELVLSPIREFHPELSPEASDVEVFAASIKKD